MKRILAIGIALILTSAISAQAGGPLDTLQLEVNKVLDILRQKNLSAPLKKEKLEAIYGRMFDEVELARRTLARNWNKLNVSQQKEFIQLYREVLSNAYLGKIMTYTDEKVVFSKEDLLSHDKAEVQTKIVTSTREIPITYRLILKDGKWRVYDVVVENVSLVQNYRSQFNAILANHTPDQMLEILRKKVRDQRESHG